MAVPAVRLIGESFVERGLISAAQLADALKEQAATSLPLGEILVGHGWVTRLDLAGVLSEHWEGKDAVTGGAEVVAENRFDLERWLDSADRARPEGSVTPAHRPSDAQMPSLPRVLALAPTPAGYRMATLGMAVPEAGEEVELPGSERRFVVARVGRAPVPHDDSIYVYLEDVTPPRS